MHPGRCRLRVFGKKREQVAEASLKELLFFTARVVCDEAVDRALPADSPGRRMGNWREGLLMNAALGLTAAQFMCTVRTKQAAKSLSKVPDWVIAVEAPRVGQPTAERAAQIVLATTSRGVHVPKDWEIPLARVCAAL